jgi:integrase
MMPLGVNAQQRAAFLGDSVTPNTVLQYNKAVFAFLEWVSSSQWELANGPIGTAIALDTAMLDYCIVQHSANPRRGNRQQCVYLKAGIQLHTGLKGFNLTSRALKAWDRKVPGSSRVPIPWEVLVVVANIVHQQGHPHLSCALILGFHTLLRASELLRLRPKDLLTPASTEGWGGVHVRQGKTGTHQFVPVDHPVGISALNWLKSNSVTESPILSGYTYPQLLRVFRQALAEAGVLSFGFGLHSLRHGGAVFAFFHGVELRRIQEAGRWKSAKSLRIYLQTGRAALLSLEIPESLFPLGAALSERSFWL